MLDSSSAHHPHPINAVRAVLPLVVFGFSIALCSMLVLLWPARSTADASIITTTHLARVASEFGRVPFARIVVDIGIYVVLLVAFVAILMAWSRRSRGMLTLLMGIGLLGIAYASGQALYTGPMFSVCGYSLILFGSLVGWASSPDQAVEEVASPEAPGLTTMTEPATGESFAHHNMGENAAVESAIETPEAYEASLAPSSPVATDETAESEAPADDRAMIDAMASVGTSTDVAGGENGPREDKHGTDDTNGRGIEPGTEDYGSHPAA